MIGRLVFGALIAVLLILGTVAQAGAYLLGFTSRAGSAEVAKAALAPYAEVGPHSVGVRRLGIDEAPMPLTVWYPALARPTGASHAVYPYAINMLGADGATALATYVGLAEPDAVFDVSDRRYPLVILSHGYAITASSYAWLAEHLATHGMVVVAPRHREALDPGALWRSTVDRPEDIAATLAFADEEARVGGALGEGIDTETVAVLGHSYGGYTALAAAGARIDTAGFGEACDLAQATADPLVFLCDALSPHLEDLAEAAGLESVPAGLWPDWSDPRVDAVVTLAGDAAMFGELGLAAIELPVMAMGGTADTDSPYLWGTELTYDHVSSVRKVEVGLEGAAHLVFAGDCQRVRRILELVSLGFCSDPAWDRARAQGLVKHYVTAFLLSELDDDRTASAALAPVAFRDTDVRYRAEGY